MKIFKKTILFALLLTIVQQFPYIKENYYYQIRIFLYVILGILACIGILTARLKLIRFIGLFFICIMLWSLLMLIFYILGCEIRNPYNNSIEIFEPIVPLGLLFLGYKYNFNNNELNRFINNYIILATIMGIANIFIYGIGLEIPKYYVENISKNQIGPILSISSIACIYLLLNGLMKKNYLKFIVLYMIIFSIDIICLALIRNRSGLLATFIIILFLSIFYYRHNKRSKYFITIALIIIVVILIVIPNISKNLLSFFYNSFTANYDISDIDNLSAGRISIYELSINFIRKNIWLGELKSYEYVPGIPHNYLLNKLVKYGLIGSSPLIFFYFYLFIFLLKEIFNKIKSNEIIDLSILLLSQGIIISFFEYTYPYGPGISQALSWLLLGHYLSRNYREKKDNFNKWIYSIY